MENFTSVYICKADLDTIIAGFLLFKKIPENIIVVTNTAPEDVLSDPQIVCLECGGSGRVAEHNFDHHAGEKTLPCAAEQAWQFIGQPSDFAKLVKYTADIDTGQNYRPNYTHHLGLSSIISGMMLTLKDQKERFIEGIRIVRVMLEENISYEDLSPLCANDTKIKQYAEAKEKCRQDLALAGKNIVERTICGLRILCLESPLPGIHGLLRSYGADISIAGNGQRWSISVKSQDLANTLQRILTMIEKYESGWGGPVHGTIIGSPRDKKSTLTADDLFKICETIQ